MDDFVAVDRTIAPIHRILADTTTNERPLHQDTEEVLLHKYS